MALVRIVVDGETIVDKEIGVWTQSLPELEKYVRPPGEGTKPDPHMQALLVLLTTSLMKRESFDAEVITDDDGYMTLRVKNPKPNPLVRSAPKKAPKKKRAKAS